VSGDVLPTILGIVLVAVAAAFVLLPFARGTIESEIAEQPSADRFTLYQQVLEAEFDYQVGKLGAEDYHQLTSELLQQAGKELRDERGSVTEVDQEIEREIAAARAAFAAARRGSPAEAR
jgi:hypothetical protein